MKTTNISKKPWYRLDNVAKLFPSIESSRRTGIFRMSITLKEPVEKELLQQAVDKVLQRFPGFRVRLQRGFFWYYMNHNPYPVKVEQDYRNPCQKLKRKGNNYYLLKVRYFKNRIAIEFFHALTDGMGGMQFLKNVVAEYLRRKGVELPLSHGLVDLDADPDPEETEDAFQKYYRKLPKRRHYKKNAVHPKGRVMPKGYYHVTTGVFPVEQIKNLAKQNKASITEYLVAVSIEALLTLQNRQNAYKTNPKRKPVFISIPVNLRGIFPTKTMRNFISPVYVGVDPAIGDFSFAEILQQVHHTLRSSMNKNILLQTFSDFVKPEKKLILKVAPLFLKELGIYFVYSTSGENQFSTCISNLGPVEFPEPMQECIERVDFIPGPGTINKVNISMLSFADSLYLSFGSSLQEADFEREFFTRLVKAGIHVKIESNRR